MTLTENFADLCRSELAQDLDAPVAGTTQTIQLVDDGSAYRGVPFPATDFDLRNGLEVLHVQSRTGSTIVALRGAHNTTPQAAVAGTILVHALMAHHMDDVYAALLALQSGATGAAHLTGDETFTGVKTFEHPPVVPDGSFAETAVAGLAADLAARALDSSVIHTSGAETAHGLKTFPDGITGLPAAANPTDATRLADVLALLGSLSVAESAAQAVVTGTSQIHADTPIIGGYQTQPGDRILDVGNTDQTSRGLWQIPPSGTGSWTRPSDFAHGANAAGKVVQVEDGSLWALPSLIPVTVDTTNQAWVRLDAASPAVLALIAARAQGLVPTAVKTANYTLAAADLALFDLTGGSLTATLPTAPPDKTRVGLKVVALAGSNTLAFNCGGSDHLNTAAGPTSGTLILLNQAITLQYIAATAVWVVQADDLPLSQLDLRFMKPVGSIATLRAVTFSGLASGAPLFLLGYTSANGLGAGMFLWNSASTAADDGGTIINPTGNAGAGRWLRVISDSRYSINWFGADPAASDNGPAINACIAATQLTTVKGATLTASPGVYTCTTAINANAAVGVILDGGGGSTGGATPSVTVIYSGTAARAFDFRGSMGCRPQGIFLWATNAAFAGTLVDFGGSTLGHIGEGTTLQCPANTGAICIDADGSQHFSIADDTNIIGGQYGLRGVGPSGFCNALSVGAARFGSQRAAGSAGAAVFGPGQGWSFKQTRFEPATDGTGRYIDSTGHNPSGVTVDGIWAGDVSQPSTLFILSGAAIIGSFISAGGVGSVGLSMIGPCDIGGGNVWDVETAMQFPTLHNLPSHISAENLYTGRVITDISAPNGICQGSEITYKSGRTKGRGFINNLGYFTRGYMSPSGWTAETFRRDIPKVGAAVLASGRLSYEAIELQAGQVVSKINFLAGTVAANTPTHQWFSLFASDFTFLAFTYDDTTNAWAANNVKSLSIAAQTTATTDGTTAVVLGAAAVAADVGAPLSVVGAGAAGATFYGTVQSVVPGVSWTLTATPPTAVANAVAFIGRPFTIPTHGTYYLGAVVVAATPPTLVCQTGFTVADAVIPPVTACWSVNGSGLTVPATFTKDGGATTSTVQQWAYAGVSGS